MNPQQGKGLFQFTQFCSDSVVPTLAAQLFSSSWNLGVICFHPIPAIQQNSWNKQVTTLSRLQGGSQKGGASCQGWNICVLLKVSGC